MGRKEAKKIYVIFDQRAQNGDSLQKGVVKLKNLGHSVSTKKINEPADAARYAGDGAEQGVDTLVAVGGDGMLNHVVNGIMRKKNNVSCSVGVIPFGTGNDFAGAGGIPVDFADALDIVIRARPLPIDVSQVNQTFFINVAVGGFPAEAVADTSRTTKKLLGKFAYLATGLANIANLDAKPVNFSAPGFEWQGSAYAFGLANGRQVGGGFEIAPKAVVNDGLFDLVIFPQTKAGLVTLIVDYSRLVRLGHPDRIIYRQVPWLNLTSRETIVLNLDGESIKGKSFRFRIHARRLPFCLPERSPLLNPLVQKNKFR